MHITLYIVKIKKERYDNNKTKSLFKRAWKCS